ncbi:MAG: single-stranded DNA-binding protein [Phascolarctobacterium sp.]|nr:MAG: single-stranded DNA-binding protein [Phascolarctobacterium sp.]
MNKIILMGRLTRDPEIRYTTTGKVVCQFTLAVDRPFANQDGQREADFINVVVWGKIAEVVGNSVHKGHRLLVEGRLQIRSYDAKDGSKRYVTEVIANSAEFVERKGYQPGNEAGAGVAARNSGQASPMDSFGSSVNYDEEIPF